SGLAPYTYLWPGAGGSNATTTGLLAGTYIVTVTDANNCTATATATITQPAALQHSLAVKPATCGKPNGSVTIMETGGTGAYSYTWTPGGATGNTQQNLAAGMYLVSITDQPGCTDTVQVTITNIPGVLAVISATGNVRCFGSSDGTATVSASLGAMPYTYTWSPAGGSAATATNLDIGTYLVTVTDANQCSATALATITQPTALAHSTATVPVSCNGMNGIATVVETGGTAPYTYQWSPTGGTGATATGLSPGNYAVTITDSHGCKDSVQVSVIKALPLQAIINHVADISCFGLADGSLAASAMGGVPPYSYTWGPVPSSSGTIQNLAAGPYFLTVTDATGCTSKDAVILPDAHLMVTNLHTTLIQCHGDKNGAILVDSTLGGTTPYLYALGASAFSAQMVFSMLPGGSYVLQTQDAKGCVTTDTVPLLDPLPNAISLPPDTTINIGDSLLLEAAITAPGGVSVYTWTPPATLSCPDCETTYALPFTTTTYTLQITDRSGCIVSASRTVHVNGPSVYIPNVFAPAANSENDHFTVYAGYGVGEVELLQVYDRWGELVYEDQHFAPSAPQSGWNGKVRGKPAPTGVYVYLCRVRLLDGSAVFFKGDVTVVR
ncbi:MAG: gliding motility-associated C-terminal domain-containing protein, partial [Saprospiraceae bacterium]